MGDQDPQADQLTWVKGSPIAEGVALVRSEMTAGPCIAVDTVNANWSDVPKSVANLQAGVVETCGKSHPGGSLYGKLTAYRKGLDPKSVTFSIQYGPLRPKESRLVATQFTVFFENPQPDYLELVVNGVCARATTMSGPWGPCYVA